MRGWDTLTDGSRISDWRDTTPAEAERYEDAMAAGRMSDGDRGSKREYLRERA